MLKTNKKGPRQSIYCLSSEDLQIYRCLHSRWINATGRCSHLMEDTDEGLADLNRANEAWNNLVDFCNRFWVRRPGDL
jgi:hypothetical protein